MKGNNIILLILSVGIISLVSLTPSAFAVLDSSEFNNPHQPNVVASFNNGTNQVSVQWNFDSLPVYTNGILIGQSAKCAIKGDFDFEPNPTFGTNDNISKVEAFIPLYYSAITSSPVTITASNQPQAQSQVSEEIPCTGSFKMDMNAIMSSETNNTPHPNVSIFLSFYHLDSDGVYNTEDINRIDELVVVYATSRILTNDIVTSSTIPSKSFESDVQYMCGEFYISEDGNMSIQIGNVLYIDPSAADGSLIAHGNNGDSCELYLYLENNQWFDISMDDPDTENDEAGTETYGFHDESFSFLIQLNYSSEKSSSKIKGGCGDCTPPTFGKDKNGIMIVQGGFSFNGNVTDVIEYHTPYHMITASTNSTHTFTLKTFENNGINNIKWFQFGIVQEVGSQLNDAEVLGTIYISSAQVEKIEETDENNLWDIINATSYIEECGYVRSDCLELSLDVIFREELKNKVIVIQAMDNSRNANTKFLNDGIVTVGESMNDPLISYVSVSKGGAFYPQDRGIVELTLTSYKNNLWQDKFGYEWSTNNYGFYIIDTVPVPLKEPDVMWQAMTRMNSNFADMIQFEKDRAVLVFDASKLISVLDETFAYDFTESEEQYKNELAIKLEIEADRAAKMTKDYTKYPT